MEDAKPVATPASRSDSLKASPVIKEEAHDDWRTTTTTTTTTLTKENVQGSAEVSAKDDHGARLDAKQASKYRGLAARLDYLAQDRPDIQFPVKEVARRMATPCEGDWLPLKRMARYLVGAPRAVQMFHWQSMPRNIDTFVDSDWAGCRSTRRSTSGGATRLGWHTVKTWSTTQGVIALSSAEAELFSMTKGATITLGLMSTAKDLGMMLGATIHSDASAALSIVQRQGVGEVRHLEVQYKERSAWQRCSARRIQRT